MGAVTNNSSLNASKDARSLEVKEKEAFLLDSNDDKYD